MLSRGRKCRGEKAELMRNPLRRLPLADLARRDLVREDVERQKRSEEILGVLLSRDPSALFLLSSRAHLLLVSSPPFRARPFSVWVYTGGTSPISSQLENLPALIT